MDIICGYILQGGETLAKLREKKTRLAREGEAERGETNCICIFVEY